MKNREKALAWWKSIGMDSKIELMQRYFPNDFYELTMKSSSRIESIYEKELPYIHTMELIYLGEKLDITKHHDLNSTNEFGFNVTVEYVQRKPYNGVIQVYHNVTQVDSLYDSDFDAGADKEHRIAFESDIQASGCWRTFDKVTRVTVELAEKLYDNF